MGQNDRKIILYDISVDLEGKRVLFRPLSSCFLKENPCFGFDFDWIFSPFFFHLLLDSIAVSLFTNTAMLSSASSPNCSLCTGLPAPTSPPLDSPQRADISYIAVIICHICAFNPTVSLFWDINRYLLKLREFATKFVCYKIRSVKMLQANPPKQRPIEI